MARAVGLNAWPVLVSTVRRNVDRLDTPSLHYFDHMVACVRLADGERCVDLTDPEGRFGAQPRSINGAVALDLRTDTVAPRTIAGPEFAAELELESTYTWRAGAIERHERLVARGAVGSFYRAQLRQRTAAEQKSWIEDLWRVHDTTPEVEVRSVRSAGLDNADRDLELAAVLRHPHEFELAPGDYQRLVEGWLHRRLDNAKTDNRVYPFQCFGIRFISTTTYELPRSKAVRWAGPELDLISEFGSLHRDFDWVGGHPRMKTRFELPRQLVEKSRLKSYNRFLTNASTAAIVRLHIGGQPTTRSKERDKIINAMYPDGDSYEGEHKDGKKHGRGRYHDSESGSIYEGQWVNDAKSGEGTMTWPGGYSYSGEWRDGHQNGKGIIRWPDGRIYVGMFKDGKRHGLGFMRIPNGKDVSGSWANDELVGEDPRARARFETMITEK